MGTTWLRIQSQAKCVIIFRRSLSSCLKQLVSFASPSTSSWLKLVLYLAGMKFYRELNSARLIFLKLVFPSSSSLTTCFLPRSDDWMQTPRAEESSGGGVETYWQRGMSVCKYQQSFSSHPLLYLLPDSTWRLRVKFSGQFGSNPNWEDKTCDNKILKHFPFIRRVSFVSVEATLLSAPWEMIMIKFICCHSSHFEPSSGSWLCWEMILTISVGKHSPGFTVL